MADIVIAIAGEVAKALVKPAIRHGQYLFCVNKVIRNLDKEKEALISKRDSILTLVEQAIQRTEIIEDPVNKWLDNVENLLKEVAKLEQDVKESGCFQGWCPTWRRYRLCREMAKKITTITELKAEGNFEPFSHLASLPGIGYDCSQKFTYFESTKAANNQILEALRDDNTYMIGLYGMGGSGKTALATEVGKEAKSELKLFDQVILVTVSQTPNIRSIQGRMADMLNLKLEQETVEGRAQRLWLRLQAEKRVLIIVDDVWKELDLKDIGIRLDDNKKPNFKVLLTTRRSRVCDLMGCQRNFLLNPLSESEGWNLFKKHADIGDRFSSNLLQVAQEISNECKGLPIAIIAVGSSLKGKGDDEWKVALMRLKHSDRFDYNEEEGFAVAFICLKLSYDYLKNKEAKMLFLMCSMFPEDHEIIIEDLIRYGVGLGLGVCENFDSLDLARSGIREAINKLVESSLLFHYEEKHCVKMHDVVRDVALRIASRSEDHKILVNLAKDLIALAAKDYFAISSWYTKTDLISYQLDAPKLEIFLLEIETKNSLDFSFASSRDAKLKVMFIPNSNFRFDKPLLLLQSTQWLTNLRTLRLTGWDLGDMSFLVNLTTLEVLDLRNCHFKKLHNGMGKLSKLKLLDLSECKFSEKINYEAIGSCSQLEELYAFKYNQGCPSQHMEDIVALPNLRRFVIQLGWFRTISYEECSSVLHLREFNISKLGASKQNVLQRAEDVCLERLHGGCKNIIPAMVRLVGDMRECTNLGFRSCSEIECLIDTTHHHARSFQVDALLPRLIKLELSEMDNLKEVWRGPPSLVLGFFKKLEQLFIRHCRQLHSIFPEACNLCNLKILKIGNFGNIGYNWEFNDCTTVISLFSASVARSLQQLEELSIEGCKQLTQIITSEGEVGTNPRDNSQLMLPNLKKLLVGFCPKLEFIFPVSFALQGLSQLQEIEIRYAAGLKYVFGQYNHEAHSSHDQITLPFLNVFQLYDLENLLGICPENYYVSYSFLVKLRCSGCPKLATSCINAIVSSKQRYQHLYRGVPLDEDQQNHLTSNLQQLQLHELPQLKFLWIGSTPRPVLSFQFLQLLELSGCSNMKSIFSMAVKRSLPELTSLSIYRCEKLEKIMAEDEEPQNMSNTQVCFPKLSKLVIEECNKLKSLFYVAMVKMAPQLSTLQISEAAQLEVDFRSSSEDNTDEEDRIMIPTRRQTKLVSSFNIVQGIAFHDTTQERQVFCLITITWSELCELRLSAALKAFLNLRSFHATESTAQGIFHLQVEGETSGDTEWKPLYSNLQYLNLRNLPELRFIWNELKFMSLEKLVYVSLVDCPKLKSIFSPNVVICLPKLERLLISNCEELEEIIYSDLENQHIRNSTARLQQQVCCFPQLFKIEVTHCSKLKCLFYGFKGCHFPELQDLSIKECSQLEQIVGSDDGHLTWSPELRYLTMMDCPKCSLTSNESSTSCLHTTIQKGQMFWLITTSSNFQAFLNLEELHLTKSRVEGIFQLQIEGETSNNSESEPRESNLKKLKLWDLPKLRFIWHSFSKFLILENLQDVSLVNCPNLKTIFSHCIVRCLPMLERFLLSNCEELEEIMSSDSENAQLTHPTACPQQEVCFPRLIKIEIKQCNKLKCLFYDSMACHFPELESLEIEECSQIEQAFGSKGRVDDESSQRWANEYGDRILFPKLKKLVLKSLPVFIEISGGFSLLQPMHQYSVIDCPRYSSTFAEANTSYQHTTTQGEYSDGA